MTFLLPVLARVGALWRWLASDLTRTAFIALLGLCAFLCWRLAMIDGDRDKWRDLVRQYETASKTVKDADAAADAEGLDVAHDAKDEIDATNQRARAAAGASDDPLGTAFGELRSKGAGGRD